MRRHMNDKNWQITRNLFVCAKHFPNGDTVNGVPDFGPPMTENIEVSKKDKVNMNEVQQRLSAGGHNTIQFVDDTRSVGQVQIEEIEVDTTDWLPKAVTHQFKEQFIGNDPRYVAIVKDNIVLQGPHQQLVKLTNQGENVSLDFLSNNQAADQVATTDGKETTILKDNLVKVEPKKFIETETGEMYEILSVEEPQENMVNRDVLK